ncbi:MAG: hypothetical protein MI861_08765 [Pirellulales bacterium]|nr:hypothetical protein [Pirellulales bacterium]
MKKHEIDEIGSLLDESLVGKSCWFVGAGGTFAPSLILAFGNKIPRSRKLENNAITKDFQENRGETQLRVYCTWRLSGKSTLCSSDDLDDLIVPCLQNVVNLKCIGASLISEFGDALIAFELGYCLYVFCDHVSDEASYSSNWEISRAGFGIFGVLAGCVPVTEKNTNEI